MDSRLINVYAKVELAKRDFFYYCNLKAPNFYKEDRAFLIELCHGLQDFYESTDEVLVINMPPRHGKSRTAGLFVEWVLGHDSTQKIMTGSYNETLSTTFSKNVRNSIQEVKVDLLKPVYSDVFPNTRIKSGDGSMNMWSLENGYNNYLATSPGGTATGFGCTLMLLDDVIKNAEEANNELVKEKHWEWFTNTMLSRLEENGKIIVIMTRWASDDLAGRVIDHYVSEGKKIKQLIMKAVQTDGSMLCDEILSQASYESKIKAMGLDIASANYQQEPIDIKGKLYNHFKTYAGELPEFKYIKNYTDTADTGDDYLCSINYGVTFDNEAYALDVMYTKAAMEITEPAVAKMLLQGKVNVADIESNNGGRGFARSVQRILTKDLHSSHTVVQWFHQSKNKVSRILSNSTWVMEHMYYPVNWQDKWPDYYKAMNTYQREGKNKHDDAPDATTGVAERINLGETFSFD